MAGRQLLGLYDLGGPHQLHHLLGLQLDLVRGNLMMIIIEHSVRNFIFLIDSNKPN